MTVNRYTANKSRCTACGKAIGEFDLYLFDYVWNIFCVDCWEAIHEVTEVRNDKSVGNIGGR